MRVIPALMCAVLLAPAAGAQDSPVLPMATYDLLADELSGDRAFDDDRELTRFHRTGGSRDFFAAAETIRAAAEKAGLEDVKLVRQAWKGHAWSPLSAVARLVSPTPRKLADFGDVALGVADNSRTTHVEADLVDVGAGTADADYEGRDVKGRIVLASGPLRKVMAAAVWKRGALGILSHASNRDDAMDAPDQVAWGRLPWESKADDGVPAGQPSTFAMMLSPRRGQALQREMAAAKQPYRVRVDIEADTPARAEQAFVEGWIRGTEVHDQQVVLVSHIQEEKTSANDDGSGIGSMLEIARALSALVRDGRLPRPRRDIRFWWVNELASQPQFFRENPGERARMLVALNQDMVGARQSLGGRVQYASRLPWSLPHPLEDVMEEVLTLVRDANTQLLTTRGTKVPQPFAREVVAVKGSREPFHARMVPYFGHSDHHAFTPARIGVPATALINWPDPFIHSTGDDLEQIDATQLERNALVTAAVALYFAALREDEVPALAAWVEGRGRARIAADVAKAVAHLSTAKDRPAAWARARGLVEQSHRREAASLATLPRLSRSPRLAAFLKQAEQQRPAALRADLSALEQAWVAITGQAPPPVVPDAELARLVLAPIADVGRTHDALDELPAVEGLHDILRFEAYNFVDGRRSAWDVYEAVAAEALSAGSWYYGDVTPALVKTALEAAEKAGAFTRRTAR